MPDRSHAPGTETRWAVATLGTLALACSPGEKPPYTPPGQSGSGPADGETTMEGSTESGSGTESTTGGTVPTDHNYAFVSSATFVPGALGGQFEADLECQALADAAGLGGHYVAWLSTTTNDAKSRLAGARGWVRTDGREFVDDVTDLINGRTLFPLRVDEWGQDVDDALVITATDETGVRFSDLDHGTCEDWTDPAPELATSGGISDAGDALWTQWSSLGFGCDTPAHLYCFGIDVSDPLEFEPTIGRVAFVSATPFLPSVGIDVADAQCQQDAGQGGFVGDFVALMATDTAAAIERLDLSKAAWVRPDGVPIVDDAADLATGLLAPLARDAEGFVALPSLVWTGAPDLETPSALESCASWNSLAGEGRVGLSSRSTGAWFASQSLGCDVDYGVVYCFEN